MLKIIRLDVGSIIFEKDNYNICNVISNAISELTTRAVSENKEIIINGIAEQMLCCIGATKKQIMSIVRREGLRWCKFSIPAGLAGGVVVVWILCAVLKWISPDYFSEMPVFRVSGISIVCGVAVGLLTVLIAAQSPAKKAAGVSPLMAVSGNAYQMKSVRTTANTGFFKIDTSLGIHHAASNHRNFILMIGSFAMSIILFLAFSPTINFMNQAINAVEPYTPDVSIISRDNSLSVPKELAEQLAEQDFVKRVYGRMFAYDIPTGEKGAVGKGEAGTSTVNMN